MESLSAIKAPTVDVIADSPITALAAKYWSPESAISFDPALVDRIYNEMILQADFDCSTLMLLEFSGYFERFLCPNFDFRFLCYLHFALEYYNL